MNELILFEGKEIRAIEKDGELWFPLQDLAESWGIDRTTPINMIARNQEVFEGKVSECYLTSQMMQCVNEQGLYLMMGRISAGRLKNRQARDTVIRFQKWVPELIQKYRKKEIVQVSTQPDIKGELQKAKEYADICQCDARILQAAVFKKHGEPELADALQVPSSIHGESGWYDPTRLVGLCNDPDLTPQRLNFYLHNKGFQVRDGFTWRLTKEGKAHGEEYWYTSTSKHGEWRIRWRESILYASGLKRPVDESQLALPARA